MPESTRKERIREFFDRIAGQRLAWKQKNHFFYAQDSRYLSLIVPEGSSVLDLGCGPGDLLDSLRPATGVGVDFSRNMVTEAQANYPQYRFMVGDIEDGQYLDGLDQTFDYIIISDTIGLLDDCQAVLAALHRVSHRNTRLIVAYYSFIWEPLLKIAELLGLRMPQPRQNFLTTGDIMNLMYLTDFDVVKRDWKQLLPLRLMGLGTLVNRYIGTLPVVRQLCLRNYVVGRSLQKARPGYDSCSVIIPCRNERGNIEAAVNRLPALCDKLEIIFVEGHSSDGTDEEVKRVIEACPDRDIKLLYQDGKGKADATYKGFDNATGDVLMILDADLTVPPEQLTKFWHAIAQGYGEYINGSRLVYPMEYQAMRLLNLIANHCFSLVFSWLLNQRYTDTLCGTKVLSREDYHRIRKDPLFFIGKDPFGDFDLIFATSRACLKIVEVPIKYNAREYGETQISRFRNGWQLLKMVAYGYRNIKAL